MASSQLQIDTEERKKQVNDFSLELEQYTLRKFDLLKDDVVAAHIQKRSDACGELDDHNRKQRQIQGLCKDLDVLNRSLTHVSGDMVTLYETCCGPAEGELPEEVRKENDAKSSEAIKRMSSERR